MATTPGRLSQPPPRDLLPMARVRCVAELDRNKREDAMSCACAGISSDARAGEISSAATQRTVISACQHSRLAGKL
jgi:hypothetical protein